MKLLNLGMDNIRKFMYYINKGGDIMVIDGKISMEHIFSGKDCFTQNKLKIIKSLPYLSIAMPEKGFYTVSFDGGPYIDVPVGSAFIAPAGISQTIIHNFSEGDHDMQIKWAFLDTWVDNVYRLDDLYHFPTSIIDTSGQLSDLIDQINTCQDNLIETICRKNILAFQLVSLLISYAAPKPKYDDISPAIAYICSHYHEKITIEQLADVCGLSPSCLLRRFKENMKTTPIAYLMEYRLSVASALLHTEKLTIGEVAEQTGFYDQFYFSRCFKKKYQLSPVQYQQKMR